MVQLSQLFSLAVVGLSAVLATPQRVFLYSEPEFRGQYIRIPADGTCITLKHLTPNLAGDVSSAVITPGVKCALFTGWYCGGRAVVSEESIENLADEAYGFEHSTQSIQCWLD